MIYFEPDTDYPVDVTKLPTTWAVTTVGDVVGEVRRGFYSGQHNDDGLGIPHLRPMNIGRDGKISLAEIKYVTEPTDLRVRRGEILFNNTNSAEHVGKTAVFDQDGEWTFSNHLTRIRVPVGISAHFVAYQFLFLWRESYFRLRSTQHVSQASVNSRTLMETVPLLVAPRPEQERIVSELDYQFSRLKAVEEAVKSARTRLHEYEKLVVVAAAGGALVPTEAEFARHDGRPFESGAELLQRLSNDSDEATEAGRDGPAASSSPTLFSELSRKRAAPRNPGRKELPQLPEGWTWTRIDEVGSVTLGRQRAPQHHAGEHMRPYLRVANVFEDRIDTSDIMEMNFTPGEFETYQLQHGDILLNEGQSPDLVGRPAMFRGEIEGACFQNTLLRFRARHGISPGFALLVFRSYLHVGRFRAIAKWTTNIAHLGHHRFAELEFPLPPLAEQERIVDEAARRLDLARGLVETFNAIVERVDAARHLALLKAFTATLVPVEQGDKSADQIVRNLRMAREASASVETKHEERPMPKVASFRKSQRTPILQVLQDAAAALTPEELLSESGIGEDLIDEFFAELKRDHDAGRIVQQRDGQGRVHLTLAGDRR